MKDEDIILLQKIESKVNKLALNLEKMQVFDYVQLLQKPIKLMYINFIAGVARGVGIAVGFTLLGALLVVFLQHLVLLNLPVIGNVIAQIVKIVQLNLGNTP